MGGSSAKDRRQQQRAQQQLTYQQKEGQGDSAFQLSERSHPHFDGPSKQHHSRPSDVDASIRLKKKRKGSSNGQQPQNQKKTKKFQKPKHLKRKLEQSSRDEATNGGTKKEEILIEIQQWQEQKSAHQASKVERHQDGRINNETTNLQRTRGNTSKHTSSEARKTTPKKRDVVSVEKLAETYRKEPDISQSVTEPETVDQKYSPSLSSSSSSSSSSDSDSSGDEEESVKEVPERRQRGRRRRGRKDTSRKSEGEQSNEMKDDKNVDVEETATTAVAADPLPMPDPNESDGKIQSEKDEQEHSKRYCVGRKPVTDFVVGESYQGSVVYVKPFGVFLDIGCHSDAFCHVSRLRDDYVESAEQIFSAGDKVDNIRVLEIDRKQKRITVSLQTEAMVEQEKASIDSRKERKARLRAKKKQKSNGVQAQLEHNARSLSLPSNKSSDSNKLDDRQGEKAEGYSKPESEMTPAEQKRSRKLARRAARRAAKEGNDNNKTE